MASAGVMVVLYLLLGQLYEQIVASRYAFGAFQLRPRADGWIEMLLVAGTGLFLPTRPIMMSQIFAWLSVVFLLVPAAVLSARQGSDRSALFMMFSGVALVMMLCRYLGSAKIFFASPAGPVLARIALFKMVAIQALLTIVFAIHVDGQMSFSLASVYDFRQGFNESLVFPLNYLLPFAGGPMAGLIVASALCKRSYLLIIVAILIGIILFGISSHKAMMFYPPFVIAMYFAIRGHNSHLYLMGSFLFLTGITFFAQGTSFEDLLGSSFANRLVFIPAQIHYYFFQEFREIGPQFWAESRLGFGLFRSEIPLPSVNYIGLLMTGDPQIGANTGWLANGYMNGWFPGIAAYAVILATTLHIIDRLGTRYGHAFIGAAFVIPIFNFVNSIDLLAGFLTGGLLMLFALFALMVRPGDPSPATDDAK